MSDTATIGSDRKRSGRQPEGPAHPRKGGLMQTLKRTISEFSEDNLTDSAAALTYYAVLSIFPALIALISIVGLIGGTAVTAWNIAKWPVLFAVVVFMIALLYYASPNAKLRGLKSIAPGAALAIVV
jgi:uncharacterized BrkB/YihY/UPF0761 family membrane protein